MHRRNLSQADYKRLGSQQLRTWNTKHHTRELSCRTPALPWLFRIQIHWEWSKFHDKVTTLSSYLHCPSQSNLHYRNCRKDSWSCWSCGSGESLTALILPHCSGSGSGSSGWGTSGDSHGDISTVVAIDLLASQGIKLTPKDNSLYPWHFNFEGDFERDFRWQSNLQWETTCQKIPGLTAPGVTARKNDWASSIPWGLNPSGMFSTNDANNLMHTSLKKSGLESGSSLINDLEMVIPSKGMSVSNCKTSAFERRMRFEALESILWRFKLDSWDGLQEIFTRNKLPL